MISTPCFIHAEIPKQTVWVHNFVFYDFKTTYNELVKCELFGITCIENKAPTFHVLIDKKYVFSDVPISCIYHSHPNEDSKDLDFKHLIYNNSLDNNFSINSFSILKETSSHIYIKELDSYIKSEYILTIDFYNKNNWFHLMKLIDSEYKPYFALIPSHKIVFGNSLIENHKFPDYKKLRTFFNL